MEKMNKLASRCKMDVVMTIIIISAMFVVVLNGLVPQDNVEGYCWSMVTFALAFEVRCGINMIRLIRLEWKAYNSQRTDKVEL